jgi:DNA-binding CsgD family transcriptional regulator
MPTVSYRICPTHGESIHGRSGCCHCHKVPDLPAVTPANYGGMPLPEMQRSRRRAAAITNGKRWGNREGRPIRMGRPPSKDLTVAERRTALLASQGLTQLQIAERLGVKRSAVSSALLRAMQRIGALEPYELFRYLRAGT